MTAFSLILASVGRTDELSRMLASLLNQQFTDFEVVLVDQNSDDRLDMPVRQARSLGLRMHHLRHHPPNLAAARNTGIAVARGDWLGFPDDDCWYESDLLALVGTRFAGADAPQGVIAHWQEQGPPSRIASRLDWHRSSRFRDLPVSSICLFLERPLVQRLGGFDPRLGVGQWFGAGEEHDLVLRALRQQALLVYEPAARVHHAVAAPGSAVDPAAARQRARGTGALYAKHALPGWVVARGLAAPLLHAWNAPPETNGNGSGLRGRLALGWAISMGRLDGMRAWPDEQARDQAQGSNPC